MAVLDAQRKEKERLKEAERVEREKLRALRQQQQLQQQLQQQQAVLQGTLAVKDKEKGTVAVGGTGGTEGVGASTGGAIAASTATALSGSSSSGMAAGGTKERSKSVSAVKPQELQKLESSASIKSGKVAGTATAVSGADAVSPLASSIAPTSAAVVVEPKSNRKWWQSLCICGKKRE